MTEDYDIKRRTDLEVQGSVVQAPANRVNRVTETQGSRETQKLEAASARETLVFQTADWAVQEKWT